MIELVYFAWVRERIGEARESHETTAKNVRDLIQELKQKEERYAVAFSDLNAIRVAIDQDLVDMDSSIENAKEVAFFPPMTGG